ncbi:nuclear transport factor 2 family protein [Rhodopseudomonas sp. P2A-2r]|uniref:nuclear transport factor 2 family protein n=1 Tax=unclassified Rhodopseudomonas TaxID=2638247 RepID=UPI002234A993|nr:nuclear transport factor 2 family protein [Rhodopseudomonas sp. P2A-2r]UZE48363.1 nuclear transport factor 2 family protein [Rhodopseudomonas sp. P2A-2r]
MTDKAAIVRALFAAYRASDRASVEQTFTDDFRFTSPFDDRLDKAAYFERCWPASIDGWMKEQDIEHIVVDGDAAFVTYQCVAKDGRSFRNTEFFTFDGDRIRSINVYFGATYRDGVFAKQES